MRACGVAIAAVLAAVTLSGCGSGGDTTKAPSPSPSSSVGDQELNARTEEYQNEAIFEVNRLAMRSTYFPFETRDLALDDDPAKSSRFLSLDGDWDFQWFNGTTVKLKDEWDTFAVPGIWEMEPNRKYGYPIYTNINEMIDKSIAPEIAYLGDDWNGRDYNPTGVYRKQVDVPQGWHGSNVTLHFGAVTSGLYAWFNGHYLGYSEDSKLQAEFDVTDFIQDDQNEIIFKVIAWTDGTYLEDQDMWRLSGLSRSVYMYARPSEHIYDIHVRAEPSVDMQSGSILVETDRPITVEVLEFQGDTVLAQSSTVLDGMVDIPLTDVQLWSAEQPHLYTVLVSAGEIFARFDVGFRRVVLSEGNLFVNGVALKIQGVNRHEHDAMTGKVISKASMLRDIQLLKLLNFNAVRTSHYPNCEEWLKLCDLNGLYVIGEANIESHGFVTHRGEPPPHHGTNHFKYNETLANNASWGPAHWARQQRMYYRDRNHPSIVIWSLGNEAGNGVNMVSGYQWLKEHEQNRIVTYEGARKEGDPTEGGWYCKEVYRENTDAYVPMYMPHSFLERYGQQWEQAPASEKPKPLFFIEYQHSMGNGGGGFAQYWEIVDLYQGLQGGFIWDWMDQGIEVMDKQSGQPNFMFGGDFGPANVISDGDFCLNGVLRADQQPQPHAFEIQHVQQFVKSQLKSSVSPFEIEIRNRFAFTTLSGLALNITFLADGIVVEERQAELGAGLAPMGVGTITVVPVAGLNGNVCHLTIKYVSQQPEWWASGSYGWDQFEIPCSGGSSGEEKDHSPTVKTVLRDTYHAESGNVQVVFNEETGAIQDVLLDGQAVLSNVTPSFWRPMTDNDLGAGLNWKLAYWRDVEGVSYQNKSIETVDGAVISRATLDFERASLQQTIIVNESRVELQSTFHPKREGCKLGAGVMFSLMTDDNAYLNLDASDRFVFSQDLTAEFQVLSVQSNVGDIENAMSFGVDAHFFARPGEPQLWPYKASLNCTGGELIVGYADATWTDAEYGMVQLEHVASETGATFTQGDRVYMKCGGKYVVPGTDGSIALEAQPVALTLSIPDPVCMVPRLGHSMELSGKFRDVRWFGKGPWDTYTDRRGAIEQVWDASVADQTWRYGRNQAQGNKFGVRWMALADSDSGVTVTARTEGEPLEMQAHHYPQSQFDAIAQTIHGNYDPRNQTVIHGGQLVPLDKTWWNIDAKQMGVGGINSWGELPLPDARLTMQTYTWTVVFDFSQSPAGGVALFA